MSFPTTIPTLTDGTVDHNYDLRNYDGRRAIRKDDQSTLDLPATMTIQHSETGSGLQSKQNSNVRFDRVVEDADGNQGTIECLWTLRIPTKIATTAQVTEQVNQLIDFLGTGTYVAQVINGEV